MSNRPYRSVKPSATTAFAVTPIQLLGVLNCLGSRKFWTCWLSDLFVAGGKHSKQCCQPHLGAMAQELHGLWLHLPSCRWCARGHWVLRPSRPSRKLEGALCHTSLCEYICTRYGVRSSMIHYLVSSFCMPVSVLYARDVGGSCEMCIVCGHTFKLKLCPLSAVCLSVLTCNYMYAAEQITEAAGWSGIPLWAVFLPQGPGLPWRCAHGTYSIDVVLSSGTSLHPPARRISAVVALTYQCSHAPCCIVCTECYASSCLDCPLHSPLHLS